MQRLDTLIVFVLIFWSFGTQINSSYPKHPGEVDCIYYWRLVCVVMGSIIDSIILLILSWLLKKELWLLAFKRRSSPHIPTFIIIELIEKNHRAQWKISSEKWNWEENEIGYANDIGDMQWLQQNKQYTMLEGVITIDCVDLDNKTLTRGLNWNL